MAAVEIALPTGYTARAYRGAEDHAAMVDILNAYRRSDGDTEMATLVEFDNSYANLTRCDPAQDIVLLFHRDDGPIGYARTQWDDTSEGYRTHFVFAPVQPDHRNREMYSAVMTGLEQRAREVAATLGGEGSVFRAFARHPGPGRQPVGGEAEWLEELGYRATTFEAFMVRPHLDDIPALSLPDGLEMRPVETAQIRSIWEAEVEAMRDHWGFVEPTEADWTEFYDDPLRDESLWKIAWDGDHVVGQVKSYINHAENEAEGRRRGYTEQIATARDWRKRGVAGALLCESMRELRDRGMTEAALGVHTENPTGAFQLYQRVGFELVDFEAVYDRPLD